MFGSVGIMLQVDNARELQRLANISGIASTNLGLVSNADKPGITIFNEETSNEAVSIQQEVIRIVKQYK